ncbi:MAG TPA: serine hydrolase [Thermoleophilaceae bacterium]|nr:serine hydrolase [Thermoleophilaceae bacterium]
MAQRRGYAIVALAAAVVLVAAGAAAKGTDGRGVLSVDERLQGSYPAGSVAYVRVRGKAHDVSRKARGGNLSLRFKPRAGLYRVSVYQRPCQQADCAKLEAPVDACSERVSVYAGEGVRVTAVTRAGKGCSMRVAEPPAFPSIRRVRAVRRYIRGRAVSSFALIDTHGRFYGFAPHRRYVTASVVKAMILVARLRQIGNRMPSASDRAVLDPMIQVSDNHDASVAYRWVGDGGLRAVGKLAHMRDLVVPGGSWGNVYFSAADQARLFRVIDKLVPPRSRGYARHLLSSIVSYQRWGFSRYSLARGWRTFFKGGWRQTGRGSLVHEAALFERRGRRFSLAVLTDGNPSHAYGTATLRGVASRIFR